MRLKDPKAVRATMRRLRERQFVGTPDKFGEGTYRERNDILVSLLAPRAPRRVLEVAAAGGHLARRVVESCPSVETYVVSNLSKRMLAYCRETLADLPIVQVQEINAETLKDFQGCDTFLTTSLEHLEFDQRLIRRVPEGVTVGLSITTFDDIAHYRVLKTETDIRARYGRWLSDLTFGATENRKKLLVVGTRRDT